MFVSPRFKMLSGLFELKPEQKKLEKGVYKFGQSIHVMVVSLPKDSHATPHRVKCGIHTRKGLVVSRRLLFVALLFLLVLGRLVEPFEELVALH